MLLIKYLGQHVPSIQHVVQECKRFNLIKPQIKVVFCVERTNLASVNSFTGSFVQQTQLD